MIPVPVVLPSVQLYDIVLTVQGMWLKKVRALKKMLRAITHFFATQN